jgi:hypothetical protein
VRKLVLARLAAARERLRSSYGVGASDAAALDEVALLLQSCDIACGHDVYGALQQGAKKAAGAPDVTYVGHVVDGG